MRNFDQATVNTIYEHYFSQEKQHLFEDLLLNLDYDTYNYQYNSEYFKLYNKIKNIYLVRITEV